MRAHQGQVQHVLGSGQSLATSGHPEASRVLEQCQKLEGCWAELERTWEAQAQCLQQAVALQQVGHREPPGSVREVCKSWASQGGGSVGRTPAQKLASPQQAQNPLHGLLESLVRCPQGLVEGPS